MLILKVRWMIVNPFNTTDLLLHPIKTSEDQGISDIFRGYRKRPVAWNELHRHWIVRSSGSSVYNYSVFTWPFKRQPQKMVKHTNNSSVFAGELFECVWSFCGVGAERVKKCWVLYSKWLQIMWFTKVDFLSRYFFSSFTPLQVKLKDSFDHLVSLSGEYSLKCLSFMIVLDFVKCGLQFV